MIYSQGHKLLSENASDNKVRQFLKTVPAYIVRICYVTASNKLSLLQQKIEALHSAVAKGSLREVQALLGKKKMAISKVG